VQDNYNLRAKIDIRRQIIEELKSALSIDRINVLEFCTGEERKIYHALYEIENTISLDRKPIPGALRFEALKYIKQKGLDGINYFDIDTYGTPYIIALNVMKNAKPGTYGMALTDGAFSTSSTGSAQGKEKILRLAINNRRGIPIPGLIRFRRYIAMKTLQLVAKTSKVTITQCKYCYIPRMSYIGIIFKKS